mmetsp:Transcript_100195/g.254899  ORF Transcript_100195/g.254899 Transcript_100195/m.254899 type:complete len:225 (+) Transcript_100195:41-715(+)
MERCCRSLRHLARKGSTTATFRPGAAATKALTTSKAAAARPADGAKLLCTLCSATNLRWKCSSWVPLSEDCSTGDKAAPGMLVLTPLVSGPSYLQSIANLSSVSSCISVIEIECVPLLRSTEATLSSLSMSGPTAKPFCLPPTSTRASTESSAMSSETSLKRYVPAFCTVNLPLQMATKGASLRTPSQHSDSWGQSALGMVRTRSGSRPCTASCQSSQKGSMPK